MPEFVRVAAVDDIPKESLKGFEIRGERIVLARTGDGIFALADECSHDSAPISLDGKLRPGGEIMCRRHGARFRLATGEVTAPPAIVPIDRYEVKIEGNDVFVLLD